MVSAFTLWVPGLLDKLRVKEAQALLQKLELPALQTLLAKSDRFPVKQQSFHQQAAFLYHQSGALPVAATEASIELEDFDPKHFWLKVDPVQMIPDRDTLVLFSSKHIAIDKDESKALIEAFNQHFAQDGVELKWGSANNWFLSIVQPVDIHTTPLNYVDERPVNEFYPTGNAAQYWRQLINEAQMLFYTHPVNENRREKGWPEINSVWVWGEGKIDASKIHPRPDAKIWSDNLYLKGLAKQTQSDQSPSPSSFAQWCGSERFLAEQGIDKHMVTLDNEVAQLNQLQIEEWVDLLRRLEEEWFEPLLEAVKDKQIGSVLLDLGCDYRCHIKPSHLRRFWRLKKSLNRI